MKRNIVTLSLCIMLLSVMLVSIVGAHPVSITDKSRLDWFGKGASNKNIGLIARNTASQGEFVWADAQNDQRAISTPNSNLVREVDLDHFSVTADSSNIYFLAKMERIYNTALNPLPELIITIDTDHQTSAVPSALPDNLGLNVTPDAAWEYALQTQFTSTSAQNPNGAITPPLLYTGAQSGQCPSPQPPAKPCAAQIVSTDPSTGGAPGSFIEITLPWNAVGGKPAPDAFWRFTVSVSYVGHPPLNDTATSAVADLISSAPSTLDEIADGSVDTYFDLHFDPTGEVFAPLLISEFLPYPTFGGSGVDPNGEWIELYNPNTFSVQLDGYKVGDQTFRGGSNAMLQLPSDYILGPGMNVVVVNDVNDPKPNRFSQQYPTVPSSQIINMSTLQPYTSWGTGVRTTLTNRAIDQATHQPKDFRDAVVLLDKADTIVDLVQYATSGATLLGYDNTPINVPLTGVTANESFERCPSDRDLNSSSFDFLAHDPIAGGNPTPGQPCASTTGINLQITKTALTTVVPTADVDVPYELDWYNIGSVGSTGVIVTDTLPPELTFVSAIPAPTSVNGQAQIWSLGSLAAGAKGKISVIAHLSASALPGRDVVNMAQISGSEPENAATLADNVATAAVTIFAPDLNISTAGWPSAAAPGQSFCYTINYGYRFGDNFGDATNVIITDTLPVNTSFMSQNAPLSIPFSASQGILTWGPFNLSNNALDTITVCFGVNNDAPSGQTDQNILTITGSPDTDTSAGSNNIETKSVTYGYAPDLSVALPNWPQSGIKAGDEFDYTITYANQGQVTAAAVSIIDTLPAGVTFVSQTSSGVSFSRSGNKLTWTVASMPSDPEAGSSGSITVRLKVSSAIEGVVSLTNNVTITSAPAELPATLSDNSASSTLVVRQFRRYISLVMRKV
jgi:uncharacterized repeat protein (TIGR01451 family)